MPGEIILCISIFECILCFHWLISAIFDLVKGRGPYDQGYFCQINSILSLMAGTGDLIYNVAFCFYIRVTLTKVLKINSKIRIFFHAISIAICITVPTTALLSNNNGLNLCGTCSVIQSKSFPYGGGLVLIAYTGIGIYTIIFFKKTVPNNEDTLIQKNNFMRFYMVYIAASCIIWGILAISQIMISVNCFHIHSPHLNIFITFSNLSKLASPIVLSIIRFQDPTLKKKILNFISPTKKMKSKQFGYLYYPKGFSGDENWLAQLTTNLKYNYVLTVLYGIRQAQKILNEHNYFVNENAQEDSQFNGEQSQFSDTYQVGLNSNFQSNLGDQEKNIIDSKQGFDKEIAINYLSNEFGLDEKELLSSKILDIKKDDKENLLEMKVRIYSSRFFRLVMERDSAMVDPFNSLDPQDNIEQIKKFKGPDGGKSGEFFFFSSDNRLIIKTISDQELRAFLQRIHYYAYHLLIIYGLFTFDRSDVSLEFYSYLEDYWLPKNACHSYEEYISMTYDMKGSEFDREALKKQKNTPNLSQITLKDLDFLRLESKIHIDQNMASRLKAILTNDANFFKKVRLMDYSLLVMKIYWKQYAKDNGIQDISLIENRFTNNIYSIPSTSEDGVSYHIAIIDYLQEWNAQKRAEQHSKKFMHANRKLDTSAQNPSIYADRFIDKLVLQIL